MEQGAVEAQEPQAAVPAPGCGGHRALDRLRELRAVLGAEHTGPLAAAAAFPANAFASRREGPGASPDRSPFCGQTANPLGMPAETVCLTAIQDLMES